MLDSIVSFCTEWVLNIISSAGYWGIALSMAIESFFVPFPSEVIMPFAGYLVSQGRFSLFWVAVFGGLGSYIGTLPFYFFGKLSSEIIVRKFIQKWGKWIFITEEDLDKSIKLFNEKGGVIVFVGRLIPGIRSVLSIPAGISKMEFVKYSFFTILGSLSWSFVLSLLGYFLGENWEILGGYIEKFKDVIIVIVILIGIYYFYSKLKNNGKKKSEDTSK
jgi:membrane protein DedA with SNARE-associated domain